MMQDEATRSTETEADELEALINKVSVLLADKEAEAGKLTGQISERQVQCQQLYLDKNATEKVHTPRSQPLFNQMGRVRVEYLNFLYNYGHHLVSC